VIEKRIANLLEVSIYLLIFDWTGVWTWGSILKLGLYRQLLYHMSHTSQALFCFCYFLRSGFMFLTGLVADCNSPINVSCVAGVTDMHHHSYFVGWDGSSLTFCLSWPQTMILLVSASQASAFYFIDLLIISSTGI
jgi:hypothetical protein